MEQRSTRSNSIPHEGTDAQFWAPQPNPRQIERGHAEAVALTRVATRTTTEVVVEGDVRSREVNPVTEDTLPSKVRGLTSTPTQEPQPPGEGQRDLQMRTPTVEEGASFSTGDISSEANTTRQDEAEPPTNAQQYRETPAHYTTGTPTDMGTPEQPLANSLDGYLGDELEDVLQNSQLLQGSFTAFLAADSKTQENKPMPLAWVIPDTTNRTLEEIEERTIADFRSPGGGTGALVILLPRLLQFYHTDRFTIDINSGKVFAHTGAGWHPVRLRCQHHPFNLNILGGTIIQVAQCFRDEISSTEQTRLVSLPNSQDNWAKPPELPSLGDAEMYISYPDVMQLATRKCYIKDRTQVGVTYIAEHSHTLTLKGEDRYHSGMLDTRLNIIFGRAQAIRERIDEALRVDNMHRRRRNMRELIAPTRFPDPTTMDRASNNEWLRWMRHEMYDLVDAIDEETRARQDDDDPFNGIARGVFQPLPRNNQNTTTTDGDQGGMVPQVNNNQDVTPEWVVPVQTIRPTPQVQRETRRNTMDGRQERTPTNTRVQTPLIHPTTMVEHTTNTSCQELRERRVENDEISSQEGVRQRTDMTRPVLMGREQPAARERLLNDYQSGYRQ